MKKIAQYFLFFWAVAIVTNAQNRFGNEWVRYNQAYLKITVSANGLYRISLSDIRQAGLAVGATQVSQLQLFHRGNEVALNVGSDFVEFYGQANDGDQDSLLYRPTNARPHPYQNLYGDVTAYFLTVGTANGLRMEQVKNVSTVGLSPESHHLEQQRQVFTTDYSFNNFPGPVPSLQQSYYEAGEGWTGGFIKADSLAIWPIQLKNWVKNDVKPKLTIMLNGRSEFFHSINVSVGQSKTQKRVFDVKNYFGYGHQKSQTELTETDLTADGRLTLTTQSVNKDAFELYSLSYHQIVYPQGFDMAGLSHKFFWLPPNAVGRSLVNITNAPADAVVYDFTENYRPKILESKNIGTNLSIAIPNTDKARTLWVANGSRLSPLSMAVVNFTNIDPKSIDYLIITHKNLRSGADAYANYRASVAGGSYKTKVVDSQDIIDQFGYGEWHPMAIRRMADFVTAAGSRPYLFLVGRPYTFPDFLKTTTENLVPSIGYPGSDVLLTAGLAGEVADVPALPTGRLYTTKNDDVLNYLAKVKEYEAQPKGNLWRKNVLHLSGGKSGGEIEYLRNTLATLTPLANQSWLGANVSAINKTNPVEVENVNISGKVNEGVSLITFFGHSSASIPDFNMGYASAAGSGLANQVKYPMMYFNGCAAGNIFFRYNPLTADWILTPNKGAIVVLANSYWSFVSTSQRHLQFLYKIMFNDPATMGATIGRIHQEIGRQMAKESLSEHDIANLHQQVLQGDPAVVIYPMTKPDYEVKSSAIFIQSSNAPNTLEKSETVQVGLILSNLGFSRTNKKITISAKLTYENGQSNQQNFTVADVIYQDTLLLPMKREGRIQRIEIVADSDKAIDELNENNNMATLDIDWAKASTMVSYPAGVIPDKLPPALDVWVDGQKIKNGALVAHNPTIDILLRDDSSLPSTDTTLVEVFLKKCEKCSFEKISTKILGFQNITATSVKVSLKLNNLVAGRYELLVTGRDTRPNYVGQPYQISFNVLDKTETSTITVFPNPASDFVTINAVVKSPVRPQRLHIKIIDLWGRTIQESTKQASVGDNEMSFLNLQSGVYIAKISVFWNDGQVENFEQKFVIKK